MNLDNTVLIGKIPGLFTTVSVGTAAISIIGPLVMYMMLAREGVVPWPSRKTRG